MAGVFTMRDLDGNPIPNLDKAYDLTTASQGAGSFPGIDDPSLFHIATDDRIEAGQPRFVALALRQGQKIFLDLDLAAGDLRLFVLNAKGSIVAENDDSGTTDQGSPTGDDPKLEFTAPATGIFIVAVANSASSYLGNFQFSPGAVTTNFELDIATNTLPARTVLGGGDDQIFDFGNTPLRLLMGGGNDALFGSNASDIVDGGAGNDNLQPQNGNDVISGAAGNDFLQGGSGNDVILGGAGNDIIGGSDGNDQAFGGAGADTLNGGAGNDLLSGGAGNDQLTPGAGLDTLIGGDGRDAVNFSLLNVPIILNLGTGTALGDGADRLFGVEDANGSQADDKLTGDAGANFLNGNQGNDSLNGGGGNDSLFGFTGNNRIAGGAGVDQVTYFFGIGAVNVDLETGTATGGVNDTLSGLENLVGTSFNDTLGGNGVNNAISGLEGDDLIDGGAGNDSLSGNEGSDLIGGGAGNDTLDGGSGNDDLIGEAGDDSLAGGSGNDGLGGDEGNDTLNGGGGADTLHASEDRDELTGGTGADVFQFLTAADAGVGLEADRITDFKKGIDKIRLRDIDADTTDPGSDVFTFVGNAFFSGKAGELRFFNAGGETVIQGDTDGDGLTDFDIVLNGTINLDIGDLVL